MLCRQLYAVVSLSLGRKAEVGTEVQMAANVAVGSRTPKGILLTVYLHARVEDACTQEGALRSSSRA